MKRHRLPHLPNYKRPLPTITARPLSTEEVIALVAGFYQGRQILKDALGDAYDEAVKPCRETLQKAIANTGVGPFEAAAKIWQSILDPAVQRQVGGYLFSAALDLEDEATGGKVVA